MADDAVRTTLEAGARRSRDATARPPGYPTGNVGTGAPRPEDVRARALAVWERWRWGIIGLGLLLLFELVLFASGGMLGGHF